MCSVKNIHIAPGLWVPSGWWPFPESIPDSIKGVIFDLDGTIVDRDRLVVHCTLEVAKGLLGKTLSPDQIPWGSTKQIRFEDSRVNSRGIVPNKHSTPTLIVSRLI